MAGSVAPDGITESERLDMAADQAIELAGGDLRSAIRILILANEYLEAELTECLKTISNGYARGRLPRKAKA